MNQRLVFIDYAKILCTLFVVYGHITLTDDPLRLFIYGFHMPFFFFVSGMLYKATDFINEIKKTFVKIILPAFIYIMIAYIVRCFTGEQPLSLLKSTLIGLVGGQTITANEVCWFLLALANVRLLTSLWCKNKIIVIVILLIGLISFWKNILYVAQSEIAFPFFLMGYYCKNFIKEQSQRQLTCKSLILTILLLACTSVLTYYNGRVSLFLTIWGDLQYGINIFVYFVNAIIGTFAILYLTFFFRKSNLYIELSANALISCVGFQSLFYHAYLRYFGYNSFIISVMVSILIMLMCIICHQPLRKLLPYVFR